MNKSELVVRSSRFSIETRVCKERNKQQTVSNGWTHTIDKKSQADTSKHSRHTDGDIRVY